MGNVVPPATGRTYLQIVRENVFVFVNNLMYVLGALLILLGRYTDALVSVSVVLTNAVVGVVQEVRAKRELDKIALLTRPRATVIRDGEETEVLPDDLVLGDLLVIRPGDQIVLDGYVRDGDAQVDESLLTGESDLVRKGEGAEVYSGSFCVTGVLTYQATKVGKDSLAYQITAGARAFRRVLTPLQRQINLAIRMILGIVVLFQLLVVISAVLEDLPFVDSVRMSVVVAGLIPNGLFVAVAIAYALGAVRMAGRGALVQQANSVESLSNVTVLCLDKTGTLTANRINLDEIVPGTGFTQDQVEAILGDLAASTPDSNRTMEAVAARCSGQERTVTGRAPFTSARKWSGLVFDDPARRGTWVLGAPERILAKTGTPDDIAGQMTEWAERGMRVLALAGTEEAVPFPTDDSGEPVLPDGLRLAAMLVMSDALRDEAKATLELFKDTGIKIKVISGDNPSTVAALARQAGMGPDIKLVSGPELRGMSPVELEAAATEGTIFGRIEPDQKEALVDALRRRGWYVAMIGDGVNDVLSLKKANLGIAMESGSQAARAVAGMILLKDSFAALPHAFREGQRILNGMEDTLKIFLLRILYLSMVIVASLVIGGFPLSPTQSSLVALLTVGIPAVALTAWAQPGPPAREGLLRSILAFIVPGALIMALIGVGVYLGYLITSAEPAITAAILAGNNPDLFDDILRVTQTAVATFSILAGIIALLLVDAPVVRGGSQPGEPPVRVRNVILAAGLLGLFALIQAIPAFGQGIFNMAPLAIQDYLILGGLAVLWGVLTLLTLKVKAFDRFFLLDQED